jgi:hypothetical protein
MCKAARPRRVIAAVRSDIRGRRDVNAHKLRSRELPKFKLRANSGRRAAKDPKTAMVDNNPIRRSLNGHIESKNFCLEPS